MSSSCETAGNWTAWSRDVRVPAFSAGLQFGISVFEGMQAHMTDGKFAVQFLSDHYERLRASSMRLNIGIPDKQHFAEGINAAIAQLLTSNEPDLAGKRLYLRSVHFSGVEEIFPFSDYPFFCNIFARPVPVLTRPDPLKVLADRNYFRAAAGSRLGSAKCAVNYTQLVALNEERPLPAGTQRLWVSPAAGHAVEELDTMAVGLMMADGTLCVPPSSDSKLPSVTMKNLLRQLRKNAAVVREDLVGIAELQSGLQRGEICGLFAASTGRGLGIVSEIQFASSRIEPSPPAEQVNLLWRSYREMYGSK